MPTTTTTGSTPLPAALAGAFTVVGSQVADLAKDGWSRVRHPRTAGWRGMVLVAWLIGIAGDAYTTLAMMGTGQFEEANSVAAGGMGVLGPVGYVLVASCLCLLFAILSVGRPRGVYATVVGVVLTIVGLAKVWTAVANVLVWVAG